MKTQFIIEIMNVDGQWRDCFNPEPTEEIATCMARALTHVYPQSRFRVVKVERTVVRELDVPE